MPILVFVISMVCRFNFLCVADLLECVGNKEKRVRGKRGNPTCVSLGTKWRDIVC